MSCKLMIPGTAIMCGEEGYFCSQDCLTRDQLRRACELLRGLVGQTSGEGNGAFFGGHGTYSTDGGYWCCYCRGSRKWDSREDFRHESSCETELARAFLAEVEEGK